MIIRIAVTAGAKREKIEKTAEGGFVMSVKEKAARNSANRRIIEIIAAEFGVPAAKIRILSGYRRPRKMLSVDTGE